MEQHYSEKLRAESIASLGVMIKRAEPKLKHIFLIGEHRRYWQEVLTDCHRELELRIKQIFP